MIDNSGFIQSVGSRKIITQKWYVRFLRILNILFPCKFKGIDKPKKDFTYLTIVRRSQLDMVAASLYSLYLHSDFLPSRIVIVSDGSWEESYGVNYFKKRNLKVECFSWRHCANYYKNTMPDLTLWAERHIWGKKMASIMYFSESNRTLFVDPDVLWYSTPLSVLEWESVPFKVCVDCCHSYDQQYISDTNSYFLNDTDEPVNCGIVYAFGGISLLNKQARDCISYQAEHCGRFAEQTVFAIMDLQFNSRWSSREIICSIDDVVNSFFSKNILYPETIARHYLWRLKWIYWTEYFKMRFS